MKLSKHVYWVAGKAFWANSNMYAIKTEKGIVVIDSGYEEHQLGIFQNMLKYWGLSMDDVTDVILTHCHFDHVGNAHRFKAMGKRLLMGERDIPAVENNSPFVIEHLFPTKFTPCRIDVALHPGDVLDYGDVKLTVYDQEGHTKGAIALLLEAEGERILFAGDLFEIATVTPEYENMKLNLAWMDGEDFNGDRFLETLRDIYDMDVQAICIGHGAPYMGNESSKLLHLVYEESRKALGK